MNVIIEESCDRVRTLVINLNRHTLLLIEMISIAVSWSHSVFSLLSRQDRCRTQNQNPERLRHMTIMETPPSSHKLNLRIYFLAKRATIRAIMMIKLALLAFNRADADDVGLLLLPAPSMFVMFGLY